MRISGDGTKHLVCGGRRLAAVHAAYAAYAAAYAIDAAHAAYAAYAIDAAAPVELLTGLLNEHDQLTGRTEPTPLTKSDMQRLASVTA